MLKSFIKSTPKSVTYDREKMLSLMEKGLLSTTMYKALGGNDIALESIFNTFVYGDSELSEIYDKC